MKERIERERKKRIDAITVLLLGWVVEMNMPQSRLKEENKRPIKRTREEEMAIR